MFSYYGGKGNIAKSYPKPIHNKITEPFAGSARYALEHFENDVLLVDKYDIVVDIWKYLQQCSPKDILSIPEFKQGQKVSEFQFDCEAQKNLVGFMIGFASYKPRQKATMWLTHRPNAMNYTKKRIAENLHKIRHWKFLCGDYMEVPNQKATWYVDPPYQFGGHSYVHSNKSFDYASLKTWCEEREGQVIVCENSKADWMDFKPLVTQKGIKGKTTECIWSNEK